MSATSDLSVTSADDGRPKDASKRHEKTVEQDNEAIEHNCWWNINTVSVLCWRGEFKNEAAVTWSTHLTSWTLRVSPIPITFFLIALIMAIEDQGFIWKSRNSGDGFYDNTRFRWSIHGVMDEKLLKNRPQDESAVCSNASACALRAIVPTKRCTFNSGSGSSSCVNFFGWDYDDTCDSYIFSHCMPWEFADSCVATRIHAENYSQNWKVAYSRTDTFISNMNSTWVLPDTQLNSLREKTCIGHTLNEWQAIGVPQSVISLAIADGVIPSQLQASESRTLLLRIGAGIMGLKNASSTNEDLSLFVYQFFEYVYSLKGFGDAHWMEVAALIFFNQYCSWVVFLPEVMQLQQQICIYFEPVASKKTKSFFIKRVLWMFCCDLFLSLRIFFIGLMIDCAAMIMSWQHGVMEITISALAILFLFDMDDVMMKVLKESLDLKKSSFFKEGLQHWIKESMAQNNMPVQICIPPFGNHKIEQRKVKLLIALISTSLLSAINLWLSLVVASGLDTSYSLFFPYTIRNRCFGVCLALCCLMIISGFICNGSLHNVLTAMQIIFSFLWSFSLSFFICSNVLLGWNNAWMTTESYVSSRFTAMFENGFNVLIPLFFAMHLLLLFVQAQQNMASEYMSPPAHEIDSEESPRLTVRAEPEATTQVESMVE